MLAKITEIEMVRHLKPPVDNIAICEYVVNLPEEQQLKSALFIIGELSSRYNNLSHTSIETAQVLQLDGLANYLQDNPEYLDGFAIDPESRRVKYCGQEVNEDVYGLDISPIDILNKRLSENFNHRYTFHYKFLLTAVKKALKITSNLAAFEDIEYVKKVVLSLVEGSRKSQVTIPEIYKGTEGISKKQIANALDKLGWTKKTYASGNVVYLKPKK
jgi:hypothetical protein